MNGPRAHADSLEPSPQLLQILEGYLEELEHGGQPNPRELLARHPDLAEPLRGCLASLEFLNANSEVAKTKSQEPNSKSQESSSKFQESSSEIQGPSSKNQEPRSKNQEASSRGQVGLEFGSWNLEFPSLGQLGDFRLQREIGRGGMGVVYEAEQISLRRRVALKVLPFAAALDAKQLQRFKNEALAAAGLQHPHIVPVHAVGSDRGVHYYAMQFIDGKTLAEVIAQLRKERGSKKEDRGSKKEDRGSKEERGSRIEDGGSRIEDGGSRKENRESRMEDGGSKGDRGSRKEDGTSKQGAAGSTVENKVASAETPTDARRSSILDPPSSILHPRSSILNPRSSFFRTVAQLGIQAADALEHAHRLGIVHRDVKPANLILDNEGKLWVTDFGLAMVQNNVDLTVTGDMVGTLRYMSPEQASAQRGLIDQRTDVYSLGATLYELLTLQPSFAGCDRHHLLAQIATMDPRSPRRQNPAIPKDLETIVLKALAKSPQERYATAEQMAEDLKRFLEDQPIHARRPSLRDRTIKWCKRHKALVGCSILLTLVASLMTALLSYNAYQAEAQGKRRAKQEQQRIQQEQRIFITALQDAKNAVDELSLQPTLKKLLKNEDPKIQQENRDLLRKIVAYYQSLARLNSSVPEARFLSAIGHQQVGGIFEALGELSEGQNAYEKSIAILQPLVAQVPQNDLYHSVLAESRLALSRLLLSNGQLDRSQQTLEQVITSLEKTLANFPNKPEIRHELAKGRLDLSMLWLFQGQLQRAEEVLLQNQQVLENLPADFPCQEFWFQKTLADNHSRLGWVYLNTGRAENARQALGQAHEILEKLISVRPDSCQWDLANVYLNEATLFRNAGQLPEAKKSHDRAIVVAKKLVTDYPQMPDSKFELIMQEHELGKTLVTMGRATEAAPLYQQSIDSLKDLVKRFPSKQNYKKELALCWIDLGLIREGVKKEKEAEEAYAKAATTMDELVRDFPSVLEFQAEFASSLYHQARLTARKGDREKACQLLQKAIQLQGSVAHKVPTKPDYASFLSQEYWLLAKLLVQEGKADLAESLFQQVQQTCGDLPELLNALAWFIALEPQPPAGNFDFALQMVEKAVEKNPKNGDFWNTLGLVHYRRGEWQPAIAPLDKARTFHSNCESYDFFFLAMAHWQLGHQDQARQCYKKALAALPKTKNEELQRFQQEAAKLLKIPTPPAVLP